VSDPTVPLNAEGGGVARWLRESAWSRAVYDIVAAIVAGRIPDAARSAAASRAPVEIWQRVLALESCGAWLDRVRRRSPALAEILVPADLLLRASSADALRAGLVAMQQLSAIGHVAAAVQVPVLALKGAARLLGGETAGTRTMSDIDLLVAGEGAEVLHATLRDTLGYTPDRPGTPDRHLSPLTLKAGLPVEIHRHLSDGGSDTLERRMWSASRQVAVGASIRMPDATALVMHALEHAIVVHRTARYRLRDVIDIALLLTDAVDRAELSEFVAGSADRAAFRTLLSAARDVPLGGPTGMEDHAEDARERCHAWRRILRVGRTRLLAPVRDDIPPAADPRVVILSQLAQASPRGIVRLAMRAIVMPARAAHLLRGTWLPPEARQIAAGADSVVPSARH
jgi:Uncharacterised nucleotidyltransferase